MTAYYPGYWTSLAACGAGDYNPSQSRYRVGSGTRDHVLVTFISSYA